ncbi:MAG: hypothetical protein M3Q99_10870 [Acidobacteriota bacterium]|nr:hypothetical protein [Acidobacteriota bacterium]
MKLKFPHLLIVAVFFSFGQISAQNAANAGKDVTLELAFEGGKTIYRIGDAINLNLSFTSTKPDYVVESYYSPRFDDVILSPTDGAYPWLYRLNRLYSYDDVSAPQKLSQSPVSIKLTINSLVRFDKPGKYKVKVLSRRVWIPSGEQSFRSNPIPLLSNEIEFEIKEISKVEEQAEVKRIAGLMDSANNLNQHQIFKRELDYLTGDASTVEKVNRFLHPPKFGGVYWLDTGTGLNIARNKKLAIELLEATLRDPNREINEDLINELVTLRLLMEDERQPSQATTPEQLWKEREARSSELRKGYYAELLESLAKRNGRIQLVTAYRIFTSLPKDDASSAAYNTTKTILLDKFDDLKHYEQSELLDRYWDKIKTPSLIPSLEKILAEKEPEPNWRNRENAFKRLIEVDQKRARAFVINEIRDPNSFINPDILKTLDDKFLPEVDDGLLEQITKLAATDDRRMQLNLQFKMLLAARYATSTIYNELLDVYKKHGFNWSMEQSGPLLAYLIRQNCKEIIPLIEDRLAKQGDKSGSNVFYNLTQINLPEGLEKILKNRLESDDSETAGTAAYYLSKYGGRENKSLIEKRYNRWLAKWRGRGSELENPDATAAIKSEAMFQVNLVESLIRTDKWKLSETELKQLKLTCLTENCRRYFGNSP